LHPVAIALTALFYKLEDKIRMVVECLFLPSNPITPIACLAVGPARGAITNGSRKSSEYCLGIFEWDGADKMNWVGKQNTVL
jgi:hypothetical protein